MPVADSAGVLSFVQAQLDLVVSQSSAVERGDYDEAIELGRRFGLMLPSLRRIARTTRQLQTVSLADKEVLEKIDEIRRIQNLTVNVLKDRQDDLACILHRVNSGRAAVASYSTGRSRPQVFELSA